MSPAASDVQWRVVPGATSAGLRATCDVVIVGAGVQGLALAYELGRRGLGNVAAVDAAYPGAGASVRNGELIRSAFASVEWTAFFHESLRRWHGLSAELDFNVLFTPAGYLVLATTPAELYGALRGRRCRRRTLGGDRHRRRRNRRPGRREGGVWRAGSLTASAQPGPGDGSTLESWFERVGRGGAGARSRIRTADPLLTMEVLCLLS